MAKKQNKRKLTSKQATRISCLITLILDILALIRAISLKPSGDDVVYLIVLLLLGSLYVFFMLCIFIFKVPDRISEERFKKMELKNSHILSSTTFTQVYFCPEDTGGTIDIMMTILRNEKCNFYAKLTENNSINLIVKDKHNEEIFNEIIDNHLYFANNFKI